MKKTFITVDANEAVARVAHKINEVIAIYPITPASPMGELSDVYSASGEKKLSLVKYQRSMRCKVKEERAVQFMDHFKREHLLQLLQHHKVCF